MAPIIARRRPVSPDLGTMTATLRPPRDRKTHQRRRPSLTGAVDRPTYDVLVRFEEVSQLLAAMEHEGVRYVLIGSMAMAARGVVRATRDIDFFVEPDADNVDRLRKALKSVYDDESIDDITSEDLAGEYPVVRYGPPDGEVMIDIISRLGDAYTFNDIESDDMIIDGTTVPVATAKMLYEMKRDTIRPQDAVDADVLRSHFDLAE
jgi:Nucleotidyl transferase AbiEii toxin, Type IV TA system